MLGRRVPGGRSAFGGNGCHGASVNRLCGGFGFSIKPTRDIDDPARTAADGFAGTRGGAAEGAAEERASGAHEVEPGIQVEVELSKNGREVGGNGSALAAADDAAGFVDQGQVVIEGDDRGSVAGAGALHRCDPDAGFRPGGAGRLGGVAQRGRQVGGVGLGEQRRRAVLSLTGADAVLDAGVVRGFRPIGDDGADRVEIDIGHCRRGRRRGQAAARTGSGPPRSGRYSGRRGWHGGQSVP